MGRRTRNGKIDPGFIRIENIHTNKDNDADQISSVQMNEFTERRNRDRSYSPNSSDNWHRVLTTVRGVSKWVNLVSTRRITQPYKSGFNCHDSLRKRTISEQYYENLNSTLNGISSECEDSSEDEMTEERTPKSPSKQNYLKKLSKSSNRTLLIYFSKLARSKNDKDELDLDFIETLVNNGAAINTCDTYGQTIFHEVARIWHCDVGKFLLALKADLTRADKFGRTPLHIAAAVNYPEMVKFLVENGGIFSLPIKNPEADLHAKTYGEEQTAIHYAAKNDAVDSLKMLIKLKADVEATDSKNRTPLQVASELDRSETALLLVEQGATVGVFDSSGLSALTLMVEKMPLTAKYALDQYHKTDRPNRKQYFYLNLLEPVLPRQINVIAKTPMQAVIQNKQMNLLLHPVFKRLLQVKWSNFARTKHCMNFMLQLLFVLLWSIVGVTTPVKSSLEYSNPFSDIWWRVTIESLAVLMTLYFVVAELYEWQSSIHVHKKWQTWRSNEMEKDLLYCHPRWPEERKYILQELDRIKSSQISYFSDWWNVFDWLVYLWIIAGVIPRIVALTDGSKSAADYHRQILATSIIAIWVRLLKVIRPFQALGPFIVMLGHILRDTLRFGFVYFEFFIPYIIAFWMIFGGKERGAIMLKNGQSSDGWMRINDLIYSVWLITVVGEYDYNAIVTIDKVMAQVLIGTYTALSGILLLNLFIALMSDTFQRVYDNAKANALMQKAISINSHQLNLSTKSSDRFRLYIHSQCAPEQLYYDDDDTEDGSDLQKVTIQIKQVVDEIKEDLELKFNSNTNDNSSNKNSKNSSSNSTDGTEQKLEEFYEQFHTHRQKYEDQVTLLHDKIDHLTKVLSKVTNVDLSFPRSPLEMNQKESGLQKLPSIFELKPEFFSDRMTKSTNEPS